MFPQDFIVHLRNIWNRVSKRAEQEEKPAFILIDTTSVAGHKLTFLCYTDEEGIALTQAKWKIKVIDETVAANTVDTKFYIDRNYNKTPGAAGANLVTYYNTGNFIYLKDI